MKDGERMSISKKKYETNKRFNDKTYEQLGFRSRKDARLGELIILAADKTNKTKSVYMVDAIKNQLIRDGITLDMLDKPYTPPPAEPKQPKRHLVYLITTWYGKPNEEHDQFFEEYVTVFQTINGAKAYIKKKYLAKANPEEWHFCLYGRYIEAENKLEAQRKYTQIAKEAANATTEEQDEDGNVIHWFVGIVEALKKYGEPDYVEAVEYKDLMEE